MTPDIATQISPTGSALTTNIVNTMSGATKKSIVRLSIAGPQTMHWRNRLARTKDHLAASAQTTHAYETTGNGRNK